MSKNNKNPKNQYISLCSMVFKTFGYNINISKKSSVWQFSTSNRENDRHYAVYCVDNPAKVRNMIKAGMSKSMEDNPQKRFVVVSKEYNEEDLNIASSEDYALLNFHELQNMNAQMLRALGNDVVTSNKDHGKVIFK